MRITTPTAGRVNQKSACTGPLLPGKIHDQGVIPDRGVRYLGRGILTHDEVAPAIGDEELGGPAPLLLPQQTDCAAWTPCPWPRLGVPRSPSSPAPSAARSTIFARTTSVRGALEQLAAYTAVIIGRTAGPAKTEASAGLEVAPIDGVTLSDDTRQRKRTRTRLLGPRRHRRCARMPRRRFALWAGA